MYMYILLFGSAPVAAGMYVCVFHLLTGMTLADHHDSHSYILHLELSKTANHLDTVGPYWEKLLVNWVALHALSLSVKHGEMRANPRLARRRHVKPERCIQSMPCLWLRMWQCDCLAHLPRGHARALRDMRVLRHRHGYLQKQLLQVRERAHALHFRPLGYCTLRFVRLKVGTPHARVFKKFKVGILTNNSMHLSSL